MLDILNGKESRDLVPSREKIYLFAVQIMGMTPNECLKKYSSDVGCFSSIVGPHLEVKKIIRQWCRNVLKQERGTSLCQSNKKKHYDVKTGCNNFAY